MKSINFEQFYTEVKEVFDSPRSWMHVRYGDGEGIVLGYPEGSTEQKARQRWEKWLNPKGMKFFTKKHLADYAIELRATALEADILGIPCLRHMKVNQDWRNVLKYLIKYKAIGEDQKGCCMDCTVDLQRKNLYHSLLDNKEEIRYISCRNMEKKLMQIFNIKRVVGYHIPPQHLPCKGEVLTNDLHFPDLFNKILSELQTDLSGKIFLVGAGGLGKLYCREIKRNGGTALDIGSLFDGWAGVVTRSYLQNIKDFTL